MHIFVKCNSLISEKGSSKIFSKTFYLKNLEKNRLNTKQKINIKAESNGTGNRKSMDQSLLFVFNNEIEKSLDALIRKKKMKITTVRNEREDIAIRFYVVTRKYYEQMVFMHFQ